MKKVWVFGIILVGMVLMGGFLSVNYIIKEKNNSYFPDSSDSYQKIGGSKQNDCNGTKIIFDYPPVNLEKTKVVVPLGLMTGNHVTPVDHQYFQDFGNDEANIEVYSPGNGKITSIQHMPGAKEREDYRLEIKHTCTISSIYIHIDTLSDKIATYAPEKEEFVSVNIPVEAGELIGYYKNNVDYNLVDTEVTLQGFIVPEHYEREPWKIHVPNTLEYFNEEIQNKIIEKSLRNYEPISGKFDYDIDGKLIGNWFEENTNGYAGNNKEKYWSTHLSISPDYLDPNHIIVSMGNFNGEEKQFGVKGNSPNPAEVGVETDLIKYELVDFQYYTTENKEWDRSVFAKISEAKNFNNVQGVILLQLIEDRKLKVEIFPGKTGNEVSGFTNNFKIYER